MAALHGSSGWLADTRIISQAERTRKIGVSFSLLPIFLWLCAFSFFGPTLGSVFVPEMGDISFLMDRGRGK
jgi:hypothetical protein